MIWWRQWPGYAACSTSTPIRSAVDAARRPPRARHLGDEAAGVAFPGTVDGFEMAMRAVVGQQISVAGAAQVLARLVAQAGPTVFPDEPSRLFPTATQLAAQDPSEMPMPKARAATLHALADARGGGAMTLDPAPTGTQPGRRCTQCPASVRGPPTTWSCGRSAIPTSCSRPTSACDARPARSIST